MEWFDLFNNSITGTIPTSVGKMTSLIQLSLDVLELRGTIPTEIGNLRNVKKLELGKKDTSKLSYCLISLDTDGCIILAERNGDLSGTIPSEIGYVDSRLGK